MFSKTIDIHDLDQGVDRKQLNLVRQRFIELNQQRYQRTAAALSDRQQQFLSLLPLLFHVNHPMLPGYFSHQTACGIHQYTPDKEELRIAKNLARSFNYNRDLIASQSAIDALFVMGSIGTIAQSDSSDLDIWICHTDNLSPQALADLHTKCQRISQWAEQHIHLEAHFFLMNCQSFREGKVAKLSSEGSGSAQHFLLLDEFYRTALWLAGKVPLWWFVPASQEQDYDNYTNTLLTKRFLREKDVIDFGGIPSIPQNEFIGAGIWQVYQGIEAPYKS
ncbi:MAG TPA: class I adenylate cyclase, partial [Cellvibrio sp.]|nr:class I adenylate cyclase [Cellvibrio sp.]